jgi:single-strand DNA-binding protein
MGSVNKVILIGNLGKDPEVRHGNNGAVRVSFSLATNDFFKNKTGEKVSRTDWHNVVLWGKLAEIGEKYLNKGKKVYIEGRLTSRSFDDKDGENRYITEVIATSMVLLSSGKSDNSDGHATDYDNETEHLSF